MKRADVPLAVSARWAHVLFRCMGSDSRQRVGSVVCLALVVLTTTALFGTTILDGDRTRPFKLWDIHNAQLYAADHVQHNHVWGSVLHSHLLHQPTTPSTSLAESLLSSYSHIKSGSDESTWPRLTNMRVCLAVSEFSGWSKNGGIGTAYYELGQQLARWGANVTVLFLHERKVMQLDNKEWNRWKRRYQAMGLTMLMLEDDGLPVWPSWIGKKSYNALQFFLRLPESERFDVIHWHDNGGYGYYSLLAKNQGWALQNTVNVVTLHGPNSWARLISKTLPSGGIEVEESYFEQMTCELADIVVAPSTYILEYLRVRGWKLNQPAYIIPNLISASPLTSTNHTRVRVTENRTVELVFYGRLEVRKGVDVFIGAVKLLGKANTAAGNSQLRVSFLGRAVRDSARGNMATWITQQWQNSPELARISMQVHSDMGRDEAIDYLLQPHRLAVIPSINENSPYTVVECIDRGVRFIASRVGGIPELIDSHDAAHVMFEPNAKSLFTFLSSHLQLPGSTTPANSSRTTTNGSDPLSLIPQVRPRASRETVRFQTLLLHLYFEQEARASLEHGTSSNVSAKVAPLWARAQQDSSRLPVVSVCITHFERPDLLLQALYGLAQQTYPSSRLQVVVVDDGSSSVQSVRALQQEVAPFIAQHAGWKLLRISNSYLGAARNHAAREMSGAYFLFLDDDDVPKRNYIEKMVRIALHNNVQVLSTFLDQHTSALQPLNMAESELPGHKVWSFAGPHLPLALLGNCMGSANIFISRQAFSTIGGFTELVGVGSEDYEFHMAALVRRIPAQVVPDPLNYVRELPGSMKKTMDSFLADFRGLVPVLNSPRYADMADAVLLLKGVLANNGRAAADRHVVNSAVQFAGVQHVNSWCYAFVPAQPSFKYPLWLPTTQEVEADEAVERGPVGLPLVALRPLLPYTVFVAERWYDVNSPRPWPYIGRDGAAPYIDEMSHTRYIPARQYTAQSKAEVVLVLQYSFDHMCGDGVVLALQRGERVLWSVHLAWPAEGSVELTTQLSTGTTLSVLVDPVDNDHCDSVWHVLTITSAQPDDEAEEESAAREEEKDAMIVRAKQHLSPVVGHWRRDYATVRDRREVGSRPNTTLLLADNTTAGQTVEDSHREDGCPWRFFFVLIPPVEPLNVSGQDQHQQRPVVRAVTTRSLFSEYLEISGTRLLFEADRWVIQADSASKSDALATVQSMPYPYISPVSAHPWIDPHTAEKYVPVLEFRPRSRLVNTSIRISAVRSAQCGDGVMAHLFIGQQLVHQVAVNSSDIVSTVPDMTQLAYETTLVPSEPLRLLVDPLDDSDCDDTLLNMIVMQRSG